MNEELYLVAYKDIEQKEIDEALWLKAMSHAGGDKTKAKWAYIELRVDQLLRDPSLRHSANKKVRKPTHQSGAYMMWFSILLFFTIISAAVVVDVEEMTLVFSNGLYVLDVWSLIFVLPASIFLVYLQPPGVHTCVVGLTLLEVPSGLRSLMHVL